MSYQLLTPGEALARLADGDGVLLDVRTAPEWNAGHAPGALHLPMDQLGSRIQELDPDQETLVVCAHGVRSAAVAEWLVSLGFTRVANVRFGMSAWPGPIVREST